MASAPVAGPSRVSAWARARVRRTGGAALRFAWWPAAAAVGCAVFGLLFVLNVHPTGDGVWFWYAEALRHGQRLYSGLHLPMQPLFVFLTEWNQKLLGESWLASKVLAAVQVVLYCLGIFCVARRTGLPAWQRGVVIASVFGTSLIAIYYRFDDYHVTGHILLLFSLVVLLRLEAEAGPRAGGGASRGAVAAPGERGGVRYAVAGPGGALAGRAGVVAGRGVAAVLWSAALLGFLAGLSTGNRLNDGAFLAVASGAGLLVFARRQRWMALGVFAGVLLGTLLLLILATGDSPATWARETIFHAAAIKGGSGSIFLGPVRFAGTAAWLLLENRTELVRVLLVYAGAAALGLGAAAWRSSASEAGSLPGLGGALRFHPAMRGVERWVTRRGFRWDRRSGAVLLLAGAVLCLTELRFPAGAARIVAISLISGMYALLLVLPVRLLLRWRRGDLDGWNRREVLFLFPAGQLLAGAMTSGQSPLEAYPTVALLLLVLPLVLPSIATEIALRNGFVALLGFLAAGTLLGKWTEPYAWHHYHEDAAFTGRVWYDHPAYGPMFLARSQLELMQGLCRTIGTETTGGGALLAMPWPYANYFCGRAPWHGYVQTWYDTSSRSTIAALAEELRRDPPEWIAYERGLDTMAAHEYFFLHGGKLPHRELDALIVDRLRSGTWSLPWQHCYNGADWLLVHTRPGKPGEPEETLLPSSERVNLCSRTRHGFLP